MIGVVKSSALSGIYCIAHVYKTVCVMLEKCGRTQSQIGMPSAGLEIQSAVRQ